MRNRPPDGELKLLELASMIDEDRPIDWDSHESVSRHHDECAVLAELRVLATLTHFYRGRKAVWREIAFVVPVDPRAVSDMRGAIAVLDPDAVELLCAQYLPLRRWARGRLPRGARGAMDTNDVVQEVLVSVIKRLKFFEPRDEGALQGYLRQALTNRFRDEARKISAHPASSPLVSVGPWSGLSPLEIAVGREGVERYDAALEKLTPEDQRTIVARCELGMSHEEVAQALGMPSANAARGTIRRALVRLAKEMAGGY